MINVTDEDAELISVESRGNDNQYHEQDDEPGRSF